MAAIVFLPHKTKSHHFYSLEISRNHSQCQILMGITRQRRCHYFVHLGIARN